MVLYAVSAPRSRLDSARLPAAASAKAGNSFLGTTYGHPRAKSFIGTIYENSGAGGSLPGQQFQPGSLSPLLATLTKTGGRGVALRTYKIQ